MVEIEQVLPKDAIQSVDDPVFVKEYFGEDDDRVIVLEADDGPARAYPVRILNFHEIVNDTVDGGPVAVTWCPLCGSAIVYDGIVEGHELTFGVSGKLADDNLVMYDRETESEWKQSSGECLSGEFEGATLSALPAATMRYSRFCDEHSDGVVLEKPGGSSPLQGEGTDIDYSVNAYERYAKTDHIGIPASAGGEASIPDEGSPSAGEESENNDWSHVGFGPKSVVVGVERGDEALAFPLPLVEEAGGSAEAVVGGETVVVIAEDGELDAHIEDVKSLVRAPVKRMFAFAWQDNHGEESFWKG